ncbi:hypothetical protein LXL04_023648 [Taraxacum kok-saghyz]
MAFRKQDPSVFDLLYFGVLLAANRLKWLREPMSYGDMKQLPTFMNSIGRVLMLHSIRVEAGFAEERTERRRSDLCEFSHYVTWKLYMFNINVSAIYRYLTFVDL